MDYYINSIMDDQIYCGYIYKSIKEFGEDGNTLNNGVNLYDKQKLTPFLIWLKIT